MKKVITAIDNLKVETTDHIHNICFQQAINHGTEKDFEKEYGIFYPDLTKQYEGLRV